MFRGRDQIVDTFLAHLNSTVYNMHGRVSDLACMNLLVIDLPDLSLDLGWELVKRYIDHRQLKAMDEVGLIDWPE